MCHHSKRCPSHKEADAQMAVAIFARPGRENFSIQVFGWPQSMPCSINEQLRYHFSISKHLLACSPDTCMCRFRRQLVGAISTPSGLANRITWPSQKRELNSPQADIVKINCGCCEPCRSCCSSSGTFSSSHVGASQVQTREAFVAADQIICHFRSLV